MAVINYNINADGRKVAHKTKVINSIYNEIDGHIELYIEIEKEHKLEQIIIELSPKEAICLNKSLRSAIAESNEDLGELWQG